MTKDSFKYFKYNCLAARQRYINNLCKLIDIYSWKIYDLYPCIKLIEINENKSYRIKKRIYYIFQI